ncbi:MAG: hypothetical protein D6706_13620 [Chloroflexi bacterium]|nr:MAG: hypothetical protein D6706_13620 [Chloroflexota bacterium]
MFRQLRLVILLALLLAACRSQNRLQNVPIASGQIKIEIAEDGFYQVTLRDLDRAGLDIEQLDTQPIHLSQLGTAVPYLINNDSLIFYGQGPADRYTVTRPYILRVGETGETMPETAVSPQTDTPPPAHITRQQHFEQNILYEATIPTPNIDTADKWFWQTIPPQQKITIPFNLTHVSDGSGTLQIRLWGTSHDPTIENDHDLDILINNQKIDTIRWDGQIDHTATLTIPPGTLQNGENTLTLDNEVPGATFLDITQLDWFNITYNALPQADADQVLIQDANGPLTLTGFSDRPLVFDITNPDQPVRLTGYTYQQGQIQFTTTGPQTIVAIGPKGFRQPAALTPVRQSHWRDTTNQADFIIITTDELAPALKPLVTARQEEGLTVAVVPVAEIYDEFGFGAATPSSITRFLQYAWENWRSPAPKYVLLVGDATSDYRNYLDNAPRNIVPSPMVNVQFGGETVSDARMVDVTGNGRPDFALGRWPVDTPTAVAALVQRTLAYAQSQPINQAIFATDGTEAQFAAIAQTLQQQTHFDQTKTTLLNGAPAREVAAALSQNPWLATYIGHGSVERWGKDDVFTLDAVPELTPDAPPIVLQLTCLTGLFAHPELTSLSEAMLTHEKGPVLIIAATSLTLSLHQEPFAISLLNNLQDATYTRIGDAFQEAKLALDINNAGLREISDTYVLFGDPTAPIVRPES